MRNFLTMGGQRNHESATNLEKDILLKDSSSEQKEQSFTKNHVIVKRLTIVVLFGVLFTIMFIFFQFKDNTNPWEANIIEKDNGWHGCSQDFCDYSFKCRTKKSRGNASCCHEHSMKLLLEMKDLLQQHNLNFWIHYGTLLGAKRDQEFIPWETDVDLQVDQPTKEFLFPNRQDAKIFYKKDMSYKLKFFWQDIGRVCVVYNDDQKFPKGKWSWHKTPYVDVYPCTRRWNCTDECAHVKEKLSVREHEFPVSPCAMKVLEDHYGKDWRVPKPGWHGDSTYESEHKELKAYIENDEEDESYISEIISI